MRQRLLHRAVARLLTVVAVCVAAVGVAAVPAQARPLSEHDRIVAFWTNERVAKAVPRDFVFDASTQHFVQMGKPGGGGGGGGGSTTTVLGASWIKGGAVLSASGKVLFAMGSSYYVCSAAVVTDNKSTRSIILTAGHCVWDPATGFATNWMFIPDYDSNPVGLDRSGTFCASTTYGCWTASSLVVSNTFASESGFTTTATQHDYAFAVVGGGGKSGTAQLDATVGSFAISYTARTSGTDSYLFGYPASQKYKGKDLTYSRGPLGFDPNTSNTTYRVASDMTGGCSGGPWFSSFDETTGSGTLMSVNSYGYSGVTALHGPILNTETSNMFTAATNATVNTRYGA
ncbi:MAG: trypsin-like serine peptidase [Ilumatobacteraceae bacterium]